MSRIFALFSSGASVRSRAMILALVSLHAIAIDARGSDSLPRIYALYSESGDDGVFGAAEAAGIRAAAQDFKLVSRLVETDLAGGAAPDIFARIGAGDASAIVGPGALERSAELLEIVDRSGAVFISPSTSVAVIKREAYRYPGVFSTGFPLRDEVQALFRDASRRGVERIAIVIERDPLFEAFARYADELAKPNDLRIVAVGNVSETGEEALATVLASDADEIVVALRSPELIARLGSRSLLVSNESAEQLSHSKPTGLVARYALPLLSDTAFATGRFSAFSALGRVRAACAYDAVALLAEAFEQGHRDGAAVRRYLTGRVFRARAHGEMRFTESGAAPEGKYQVRLLGND